MAPGSRCDVPVTTPDFYPTFLELAGVPQKAGIPIDGRSIVPLLSGNPMPERPVSYTHLKAEASSKSGESIPLRWLTTGDAAAKAIKADDRIVAAINEKLGINLTVEIVPEANTEKVNVAMASGDFPDVVTGAYGTSATQQWICLLYTSRCV